MFSTSVCTHAPQLAFFVLQTRTQTLRYRAFLQTRGPGARRDRADARSRGRHARPRRRQEHTGKWTFIKAAARDRPTFQRGFGRVQTSAESLSGSREEQSSIHWGKSRADLTVVFCRATAFCRAENSVEGSGECRHQQIHRVGQEKSN